MEADNDVQHSEPKQASSTLNSNIVSVLEARREMYVKALATAKTAGDASKVRRFDRQLKVERAFYSREETNAGQSVALYP